MTAAALVWGVAGLIAVILIGSPVRSLFRASPARAWRTLTAAFLLAAGAVPLAVLGVLLYARGSAYTWAIRGPGVFSQLGGGPFLVFLIAWAVAMAGILWGVGLRLLADDAPPSLPRRPRH